MRGLSPQKNVLSTSKDAKCGRYPFPCAARSSHRLPLAYLLSQVSVLPVWRIHSLEVVLLFFILQSLRRYGLHSKYFLYLAGAILLAGNLGFGQSINSGTLTGTVTDPSGAALAGAKIELRNAVTGFQRAVNAGADGTFRFNGVQANVYQLSASAAGFAATSQQVDVHGSVPVNVNLTLQLAAENTTVNVEASGATVETDPSAHEDVDRSSFLKLPTFDPGGALSQAITYSTGGVAEDSNGFFHHLGDHEKVSFVIDGQPISDQQRARNVFHTDCRPSTRWAWAYVELDLRRARLTLNMATSRFLYR